MKRYGQVRAAVAGAAMLATMPAFAQNSVTLYGVVDNGIGYQSNASTLGSTKGGKSAVKMVSGVWLGDRFGLKGSEDLGGGTRAIFQLEEGFSAATGAEAVAGVIFSRLAFVGLTNPAYGTLTAGRQYASYYNFISPYSPTTWLTGFYGAHPGDIDGMDTIYRANNTLEYTSPNLAGFSASASYSLGGVAGSTNAGSTWSGALQYAVGPVGAAVAFSRINNSTPGGGAFGAASTTSNNGTQIGVSAVTNGYQTARAQQRLAVGAIYHFNSAWDVSATYSNVQYIPGAGSSFANTEVFNTGGVVLHWKACPALDLAAGYSYTRASKANGISDSAQYQQFNLSQYYSLSKRTGLYALEAYQRANGQTLGSKGAGDIIDATASVGDGFQSSPSSTRNMVAAGVGIVHRF
ncbi:porin [Burkholderia multivorans]|uniref:porin n=1 Tax=Burkholderia multivorans TaxID=87883 RepID=UPI0019D309CC|nr:porin [Burkholderia multivorans]MBN7129772.1 porin [Burkholderia multivorans]QSL26726.1 porin [Burkholderia multivorans]